METNFLFRTGGKGGKRGKIIFFCSYHGFHSTITRVMTRAVRAVSLCSPYPHSSLTHALRSVGLLRNQTPGLVPVPARPFGCSVSDSRVAHAPPPSPCPRSSLTGCSRPPVVKMKIAVLLPDVLVRWFRTTANIRGGEGASNVVVAAIPHHRVTQQIIRHCQPFKDVKQTFAVSRRAEQLCLRTQRALWPL